MKAVSARDLIARLETLAAAEPGGAIAFDGDGTLWSGDVGEDLFEALLADGRVLDVATKALAVEAQAAGLATDGSGVDLARRIEAAYHAGAFAEERLYEIMTWLVAGWSASDAEAFADRMLDEVGLQGRLHGETLEVIAWAKARDVTVFLVSASPRVVVHPAARRVGIDLAHVASAHEQRDRSGVVLPAVDRPIPYGPGKVVRLREKLGPRPLYAAFGDNAFDVAMLAEARIPVAVRPKPRLRERANELPDLVVLDPA